MTATSTSPFRWDCLRSASRSSPFIVPMRDYLRIPLKKENVLLGDFFMMTFMFTALNAFLESFFFRRVDPVWLFFVISVLGLRMVARRIIPAHPA
ncbi:MAG: hypothetical protein R3D70_13595 [Rhizobiaceae bacterium]